MDENIQQVHTMVGNLRNMAIDMVCKPQLESHLLTLFQSTEVSNQNRQLSRIQEKVRIRINN